MLQQIDKKKVFLYIIFLLILTSINNINFKNIGHLKINKFIISGLENENKQNLLQNLKKLKLDTIFFLKQTKIKNIIESNNLVETYFVNKEYPSTLNIKIKKTNLLANTNINSNFYYIGSNGKLIKTDYINENLPYLYGNPKIDQFIKFKKIIDLSKFEYNEISDIYFYPSNRWDIKIKNEILIKLPQNKISNILDLCFDVMKSKEFSNIEIIDARIKNQLIIK